MMRHLLELACNGLVLTFDSGRTSTRDLAICCVGRNTAALLSDGSVLIEAGSFALTNSSPAYNLSELYNPWQAVLDQPNVWGLVVLLTNGQVLVVESFPQAGIRPRRSMISPPTSGRRPSTRPSPFLADCRETLTQLLNGQVPATANNYALLFTP
jgi:hypothetical protein